MSRAILYPCPPSGGLFIDQPSLCLLSAPAVRRGPGSRRPLVPAQSRAPPGCAHRPVIGNHPSKSRPPIDSNSTLKNRNNPCFLSSNRLPRSAATAGRWYSGAWRRPDCAAARAHAGAGCASSRCSHAKPGNPHPPVRCRGATGAHGRFRCANFRAQGTGVEWRRVHHPKHQFRRCCMQHRGRWLPG